MSIQTTFLGPLVSLNSAGPGSQVTPVLLVPNGAVFNQGPLSKWGSNLTTGSHTSLTLADGEAAFVQSSATQVALFVRSGVSIFRIVSIAGAVL